MLVAWVALVVSQTLPRCPAEQQPQWSSASAIEKRNMVRVCTQSVRATAPELSSPPAPIEPPAPRRVWRYRVGMNGGAGADFLLGAFDFPHGFGMHLSTGGFFGFEMSQWVELRILTEITAGVGFDAQTSPTRRFTVAMGPQLVIWAGPVGVGASVTAGASLRDYFGINANALASFRVRLGEQPRHEIAFEGGVNVAIGLPGGDYLPGAIEGVGRLTYTLSWGFMERTHRVTLPASSVGE